MTKNFIPIVAFLILLLLTIPFSSEFATSIVPGWHTTIFPPYFIWTILVMVALLFGAIGYWLLSKRTKSVNWILFCFHAMLTIPAIIHYRFPTLFINRHFRSGDDQLEEIAFSIKLLELVWAAFVAGQVLFFIYFIRTIKLKRTNAASKKIAS